VINHCYTVCTLVNHSYNTSYQYIRWILPTNVSVESYQVWLGDQLDLGWIKMQVVQCNIVLTTNIHCTDIHCTDIHCTTIHCTDIQRGINTEKGFTEDGRGMWLNDKDGHPNETPTLVDAVVFATGYRQQAGFALMHYVLIHSYTMHSFPHTPCTHSLIPGYCRRAL
jgi:hypothetical protein